MNLLFIFGTRPEAIKMAPLIKEFQKYTDKFAVSICVTGQHRNMLDQILGFFSIKPDFDLDLMKPDQTLFDLSSVCLKGLEIVLDKSKPDFVFVQGDTTTAMIGALAAFYKEIKVAHIEAGLRSHNKYSPFPEEINRKLISSMADYHFAPTQNAVDNLIAEGIRENVWNVGNTVIDALFLGLDIIRVQGESFYCKFFDFLNFSKKIILITGHRRESFGEPFENICNAIKCCCEKYPDIQFVYPVHLNPNVQSVVNHFLSDKKNVFLIAPLDYPYLIWIMKKSYLVLTDSGGIQEEAPALGKPVLVMRDVTERTEGIDAGTALLVGTKKKAIETEIIRLIEDARHYTTMANAVNPYGDGKTSEKIIGIVSKILIKTF